MQTTAKLSEAGQRIILRLLAASFESALGNGHVTSPGVGGGGRRACQRERSNGLSHSINEQNTQAELQLLASGASTDVHRVLDIWSETL